MPQRPRTTVALTGTFSRPPSHLSFDADLALQYSARWLALAGSLKVPASGVLRRALTVYAHYLAQVDSVAEFAAVKRTCAESVPREEEQRMAHLRLYAAAPGEPLPPFIDIVRSPVQGRAVAELTERADALAELCMSTRPARRGKVHST